VVSNVVISEYQAVYILSTFIYHGLVGLPI
jgi:hypothetical protein